MLFFFSSLPVVVIELESIQDHIMIPLPRQGILRFFSGYLSHSYRITSFTLTPSRNTRITTNDAIAPHSQIAIQSP